MGTPVQNITSPAGDIPPDTLTRAGKNVLGKDDFLKLLVAQLANQDPTKPEDTSAFVAQLAQFSALEQQQNTVARLDTLLMGQATANQTAAGTFIGKDVTYRGGELHFDGANSLSATLTLPQDAAKVTVAVRDGSGRTVRTIQLGAHDDGTVPVTWDGRDDDGNLMPSGDYTLTPTAYDANDKAVAIDLSTTGHVSGVAFQSGIPYLKVGNALIKMSDVTSINERNTP
jgi:flagellar basal-body rod modification protein FlgD